MKLQIRYYGHPDLRKKAKPIEEITPEIRKLAEAMIEATIAYNGVGLAGPQVGHVVAGDRSEDRGPPRSSPG